MYEQWESLLPTHPNAPVDSGRKKRKLIVRHFPEYKSDLRGLASRDDTDSDSALTLDPHLKQLL